MRRLAVILCTLLALQLSAQTKTHATKKPAKKKTTTTATKTSFKPADGNPIQHTAGEKRNGPDELYPNVEKNPGAANPDITQDNIAKTICSLSFTTKTIRPPAEYTDKLKKDQMAQIYNDTVQQTASSLLTGGKFDEEKCKPSSDSPHCYEEDHIVSLENGGAPSDPKNLWPERYNTDVKKDRVGAHEKDKVENYVHNGICLGVPNAKFSSGPKPKHRLTLEDGQRILAIDWYACYQSLAAGKDCQPPK